VSIGKKLVFSLGCVLIIGGALALAWYAYIQLDMFRTQRAVSRLIDEQKARYGRLHDHSPVLPHTLVIVPPHLGEPIGRMEIPRLHLSVAILEGTAPNILRVAAGHINGTALPGAPGNICIAAHRDTLFRPLREVQLRDAIVITTTYGSFRYIVDMVEIVNPSDVRVLRPTTDMERRVGSIVTDQELTLITCYPFTYVGPAPKRLAVHARLAA
jgi:LPXTG-site transpeptidase (sortase) family protein